MLLRALRHPRAVMTFSDSGAHLSQIADSSIHTHLLGYWVRDRQEFTLEEAVRMITLAPALAWGFHDRGLLRPGMAADLNVFDPATVGPAVPDAGRRPPGGGRRLEQRSQGFLATLVNGQVTIRDGEPTGVTPGPPADRRTTGGSGRPDRQRIHSVVACGAGRPTSPRAPRRRGSGSRGSGRPSARWHRSAGTRRRSCRWRLVGRPRERDQGVSPIMCMLCREGPGRPHGLEPLLQRLGAAGCR
jgi:hypothetical protein